MLPAVRFVRWTVLVSVLVAVAVAVVLAGRSPSSPQSLSAMLGGGYEQTQWGPLGPSDRDMLIKVRQANLWEGPMAEQASQRASSPAVREVGRKIANEHARLDADLRAVAGKLQLALPSQPNDAQKVWMAEITGASQANFDKTFVNIVRSAHGEVMPLVEGVRSGTQNELVRQFGIEASQFIGRHMDYLESTGLVDYALFPPSTAPVARLTAVGGYNIPITLLLFMLAVLVAAALLRGVSRTRPGVTRAERMAWWLRVGRLVGGMRPGLSAGRSGPMGLAVRGRRRGVDAESLVTTAELIAVLNPPNLPGSTEGLPTSAIPLGADARVPAGAASTGGGATESVSADGSAWPDSATADGSAPADAAASAATGRGGAATLATPLGPIPSQRATNRRRTEPAGHSERSGRLGPGSGSGRSGPARRITRPVLGATAPSAGVDRKPPKLGRARGCRPW